MNEFKKSLQHALQSFRYTAIYETCLKLRLNNLLKTKSTAEKIAENFRFNKDATKRFLNAASYLGVICRNSINEYSYASNPKIYSDENTHVLFWLINSKISDRLVKKPIRLRDVRNIFDKKYLEKAIYHQLLGISEYGYIIVPDSIKENLLIDGLDYLGPLVTHLQKIVLPMFQPSVIINAMRTGRSQWNEVYGKDVSNPFLLYPNDPELLEIFTEGLHDFNKIENDLHASKINLKDVKTVLDVGGGSGAFLLALEKYAPRNVRFKIYETVDSIPLLKKVFIKKSVGHSKICYVEGSFFENVDSEVLIGLDKNTKFDLIILAWILHDWPDEKCNIILKKVHHHLSSSGRLILLESIMPDDFLGEETIRDVTMLLQTEGRERCYFELMGLLKKAGFSQITWEPSNTLRQVVISCKEKK